MKILYLQAYYTPEIAASLYLTDDIIDGMVKAGHTVDLYVPTPTRGISRDVRKQYVHRKKEVLYDGKLTVHRVSLYNESMNTVGRMVRYLIMNIQFIFKSLSSDADILFCESTPPTQGMMAGIIKSIKKMPYVYNLQDIFPDSLVNTGLSVEDSAAWKIGRIVEDFSYKKADKIIAISDDFKNNILKKGVPEDKIVVVPNWGDTQGVTVVERSENLLFKRYSLDKDLFYISYSGNIGYTQNMDMLLDCAKKLRNELPDVRFLLIGDGAAKADVEKRVQSENIDNVILLPFQPYEDIAHVFSAGDAGLIISKQGVGENSVPSKTWGYMAAQRPILASFDINSDLCRLIDKVGCGVTCEANDAEAFVNGVKELYKNRKAYAERGEKGRKYLTEELHRDKCVGIYVKTLEDIIKK